MDKTIWKYSFAVSDTVTISMPEGADIIHVEAQPIGHGIDVWAIVTPDAPLEQRTFQVRGTGHPMKGVEKKDYIKTCLAAGGALVWHVFEKGKS